MKNILLSLIFILGFYPFLIAQPGALDPTFNTFGTVTTDFQGDDDKSNAIAIQPDGKVVLVGSVDNTESDFGVARYNTDGSLDNTFSSDGKLTLDLGDYDVAYSVAVQPDGKILVGGNGGIARYQPNGVLDNSFSIDGMVKADTIFALAIALQPDSKIIVSGFNIQRYNPNGTLDATFGNGGTVALNGRIRVAYAVGVQTDGKIVIAGRDSTLTDFAIARLNSDGSTDIGFGNNGAVTADMGEDGEWANSLAIQTDGKIVVTGPSEAYSFFVLRFNTDGTLDNSFDNDGIVSTDFGGGGAISYSLALQQDGKIVISGVSGFINEFGDYAVARYNTDGSLDSGFGTNGMLTTDFMTFSDRSNAIAIAPDGKIVVSGYSNIVNNGPYDFSVARYLSGLNVGILDFSKPALSPMIYPNPLQDEAVLEFELMGQEVISVYITDLQGKVLFSILENEILEAGVHKQPFKVPQLLSKGNYNLIISSETGQKVLRVLK